MKIWIINDDEEDASLLLRDINATFPAAECATFEHIIDAMAAVGSPDAILIDLSAVGYIMLGPESCYSPIATLACNRPGASLLITSAVSRGFAQEVADRVKDIAPDSDVRIVDFWAGPVKELRKLWPEPAETEGSSAG